MRPNHHQFVAFAFVVREGSFSAAAARLGVTQSTVTQHVAKLERQVGTPLLLRHRDGVRVTRTGQEFFDLADRLSALDIAIGERLEGFAAINRGHLKVIANAPQPALQAIHAFHLEHPDVQIDFALHDWTTATRMLRERRADVGLITDAPNSEEWERIALQDVRYVAYLPRGAALAERAELSLTDLQRETVILPESGSLTEKVVRNALKNHKITLPHTIRMTTFPVMCEAVLQGLGLAIFLSGSGHLARGLIERPIAELSQTHTTAIVAPRDRARLRLIGRFIEMAVALELS